MSQPRLCVECVVSEPFSENSYVIFGPDQPECIILDPGLEPDKIDQVVAQYQLRPIAILNTHGHSDHIAGNGHCKQCWPESELIIGEGDAAKLTDADLNLSAPFGFHIVSPPADRTVRHGDQLQLVGLPWEVLAAPGHSCGHVLFVCKQVSPWVVFGGDVLFQGSVGRTDFPDGSLRELVASIHGQLFTLPADTLIYPGHGPVTTVGDEILRQSVCGHARRLPSSSGGDGGLTIR